MANLSAYLDWWRGVDDFAGVGANARERVTPVPRDLSFELTSNPTAPRLARTELLELAPRLSQETISDLALIVSELVTNSVRFGPGSPINVSIRVDPDGIIRGRVDDGGTSGVEIAVSDPTTGTGLGLLIVDSLAQTWGVAPGTASVWFELAYPPRPTRLL